MRKGNHFVFAKYGMLEGTLALCHSQNSSLSWVSDLSLHSFLTV